MPTPRIVAIHDLSGFGRCALTIVIPVLSAMGVQCCPLPTALLSTHTGGFQGNTFLDLTNQMKPVAAHWRAEGLTFDAVYTGFMSSADQMAQTAAFIHTFRSPVCPVIIDPVMGDNGRAYRTYTREMCQAMASLAEEADVLTPNRTEAALLLEEDYDALRLDRDRGTVEFVSAPVVDGQFHGTGDLFASVLAGGLVRGWSLAEAAGLAAEFVSQCARRTWEEDTPRREGVDFEPLLWRLGQRMEATPCRS